MLARAARIIHFLVPHPAMKTAIAVRHVAFEDLGTLEPVLRRFGYQVRYLEAGVDDVSARDGLHAALYADLMIVLGGPVGAFDDAFYPYLADETNLIRYRLQLGLPIIGICLGAQLMARALNAKVAAMPKKEIGFAPLRLHEDDPCSPLAALAGVPVLHWHGDQFTLPRGARRLASTEACPNQAFIHGANALALQFHLEADHRQIEKWLIGHAGELAQAGISPVRLRRQAQDYGPMLEKAAHAVMTDWLSRIAV